MKRTIIAICFLFYAFFAYFFPGDFYGKGWSIQRLATYMYLDANGILGQPLQVGASIVLVFVLFGETLYAVGGAEFLSDFALALMGRYRGGQAKIAIVSSSLFGNISGSAVANVVVDGAFTIPMMKKAGYPAPVAAAVEAVASTGGQIMPPVMGAAAFVMAEFLAVSYFQVTLWALIPASMVSTSASASMSLERSTTTAVKLIAAPVRAMTPMMMPAQAQASATAIEFFAPSSSAPHAVFHEMS